LLSFTAVAQRATIRQNLIISDANRLAVPYNCGMKVFWHQGGLQIQPESEKETKLIADLLACIQFEEPETSPRKTASGVSGSSLSCEELFDSIVSNRQVLPGGLPLKPRDKQAVIPIHVTK
jgi:hypothetical protein